MDVHRLDDGTWSNADEDRIVIEPYDPNWPVAFEHEAAALADVIPRSIECTIEHFGSTAIPGLAAKPVIDILLIVPQRSRWPDLIRPIESLGYVYWSDNPARDRLFFVKGMPPHGTRRTHHVHVRAPDDVSTALAFRDYLRMHPKVVAAYEALKRSLASVYETDREAYTQAKGDFVERVLTQIQTGA